MTYAIAKAARNRLEADAAAAGARLRAYPKGPDGRTLESARSDQWRADRATYDAAARALQAFNRRFVRTYRAEIAAERAARS